MSRHGAGNTITALTTNERMRFEMARHRIQHNMDFAYVYAISVDGVIRYIGKGRGYRVREHFRIARLLNSKRMVGKKIRSNRFYNRLASAMKDGAKVDEIIIADGLSDSEAFSLEIEKISSFPTSQLWNTALGGQGMTPEEARSTWSKERRLRQSEVAKKIWSNPESRKRHSITIKTQWQDPEYRANHSEKQKLRWKKPGARENGRAQALKVWSDPEFRSNMKLKRKAAASSIEARAERSERFRLMWQDPVIRARLLQERKARWEVDGARQRQSIAQKARRRREPANV